MDLRTKRATDKTSYGTKFLTDKRSCYIRSHGENDLQDKRQFKQSYRNVKISHKSLRQNVLRDKTSQRLLTDVPPMDYSTDNTAAADYSTNVPPGDT